MVTVTMRFSPELQPDTLQPDQVQSGRFVGGWRRADGDWQLLVNISNGEASPRKP
jgi:hypothetical protein